MPAPRMPSVTEIQGPDRRVDDLERLEPTELARKLREAQQRIAERDERIRQTERTNDALLMRVGSHVQEKQSIRPSVEKAPTPEPAKPSPPWVTIVVALISALSGGGSVAVVSRVTDKPAAEITKKEFHEHEERLDAVELRSRSTKSYLKRGVELDEKRRKITGAIECRRNGGYPFARGIICKDFDVKFQTPPRDNAGAIKVDEDWPEPEWPP